MTMQSVVNWVFGLPKFARDIYIYIVLFLVKCKGIMLKWGILQFPYFADLIFHVCTYVHGCFCISFYL